MDSNGRSRCILVHQKIIRILNLNITFTRRKRGNERRESFYRFHYNIYDSSWHLRCQTIRNIYSTRTVIRMENDTMHRRTHDVDKKLRKPMAISRLVGKTQHGLKYVLRHPIIIFCQDIVIRTARSHRPNEARTCSPEKKK